MGSINKNQPTVETQHTTSLQELWNRFGNNTYTIEDLVLILDLVKDDENLQEFYEVSNRIRNTTLPETKEQQEAYRKEAAQIIAGYEKNLKIKSLPVYSLRKIGRSRKLFYAAAATLLLGLSIPSVYHYLNPKTEQAAIQYIEVFTQRGEIKTIFLPDQTKVTLNAESRVKYPAEFPGGERQVELQGQALFEVTSSNDRQFTVTTTDMRVRVLGTVFDVRSYTNDESSTVSVVSGKVEVDLAGENIETWRATSILLEKNHQVKVNKASGNFEKLTIDAGLYLSWTDGTLYFYRTPICEVVNILNRHYPQLDIELADGEYFYLITGEHNNVYQPEDILKGIAYTTGLKCKKTGNKYTLYNEK